MLDVFFITISHCAWRHVISFSTTGEKETEAKKTPLNHRRVSVSSVQARSFWHLIAQCSPDSIMFEPLLLANPDTNTLRSQRSRASTMTHDGLTCAGCRIPWWVGDVDCVLLS